MVVSYGNRPSKQNTNNVKVYDRKGENMVRIAGVDIPNDKRVVISLTYVYGMDLQHLRKDFGCCWNLRRCSCSRTLHQIKKMLSVEVDAIKVEGDLRREVNLNIKRLMEIGSYRGIRHRRGLPVRGQNT